MAMHDIEYRSSDFIADIAAQAATFDRRRGFRAMRIGSRLFGNHDQPLWSNPYPELQSQVARSL